MSSAAVKIGVLSQTYLSRTQIVSITSRTSDKEPNIPFIFNVGIWAFDFLNRILMNEIYLSLSPYQIHKKKFNHFFVSTTCFTGFGLNKSKK